MLKAALLLGIAVLISSCGPDKAAKKAIGLGPDGDRPDTKYSFNGEIEGCKLYAVTPRFGREFQLAICDGRPQVTSTWSEPCGKGCTREQSLQTVVR